MAGFDHVRTEGRTDPGHLLFDTLTGFSAVELWVLHAVRHWGTRGLIVRTTLVGCVVAGTITGGALAIAADADSTAPLAGAVVAAAAALVIAPPIVAVIVRLVARLDETTRRMVSAATTDPLTGVFNRRGFFDGFDPTTVDTDALAAALIDVDDFKALNDRFGHEKGDAVLRHTATWLRAHSEGRGAIARLGGDEFVMVAPERLITRLNARETLTAGDVTYTVTIGSTAVGERDLRTALADADAELYRNKTDRKRR